MALSGEHSGLDCDEDQQKCIEQGNNDDCDVVGLSRVYGARVPLVRKPKPVTGVEDSQELGQDGYDGSFAVGHRVDAVGAGEVEGRRRGVATDDDQQPVKGDVEDAERGRQTEVQKNDEDCVTD